MWITGAVSFFLYITKLKIIIIHHFVRCSYFDDEEVDINEWSTSWLQNLLAKEMRFENLVRLWGKVYTHRFILPLDYSFM